MSQLQSQVKGDPAILRVVMCVAQADAERPH